MAVGRRANGKGGEVGRQTEENDEKSSGKQRGEHVIYVNQEM